MSSPSMPRFATMEASLLELEAAFVRARSESGGESDACAGALHRVVTALSTAAMSTGADGQSESLLKRGLALLSSVQTPSPSLYDNLYNNLASLHSRKGRIGAALKVLRTAADVNTPPSANTHLNLSAVLSQLGKHSAALNHARAAVLRCQANLVDGAKHPNESLPGPTPGATLSIAYFNLAVMLEANLQQEEALEWYKRAASSGQRNLTSDDPDLAAHFAATYGKAVEALRIRRAMRPGARRRRRRQRRRVHSPATEEANAASGAAVERLMRAQDERRIQVESATAVCVGDNQTNNRLNRIATHECEGALMQVERRDAPESHHSAPCRGEKEQLVEARTKRREVRTLRGEDVREGRLHPNIEEEKAAKKRLEHLEAAAVEAERQRQMRVESARSEAKRQQRLRAQAESAAKARALEVRRAQLRAAEEEIARRQRKADERAIAELKRLECAAAKDRAERERLERQAAEDALRRAEQLPEEEIAGRQRKADGRANVELNCLEREAAKDRAELERQAAGVEGGRAEQLRGAARDAAAVVVQRRLRGFVARRRAEIEDDLRRRERKDQLRRGVYNESASLLRRFWLKHRERGVRVDMHALNEQASFSLCNTGSEKRGAGGAKRSGVLSEADCAVSMDSRTITPESPTDPALQARAGNPTTPLQTMNSGHIDDNTEEGAAASRSGAIPAVPTGSICAGPVLESAAVASGTPEKNSSGVASTLPAMMQQDRETPTVSREGSSTMLPSLVNESIADVTPAAAMSLKRTTQGGKGAIVGNAAADVIGASCPRVLSGVRVVDTAPRMSYEHKFEVPAEPIRAPERPATASAAHIHAARIASRRRALEVDAARARVHLATAAHHYLRSQIRRPRSAAAAVRRPLVAVGETPASCIPGRKLWKSRRPKSASRTSDVGCQADNVVGFQSDDVDDLSALTRWHQSVRTFGAHERYVASVDGALAQGGRVVVIIQNPYSCRRFSHEIKAEELVGMWRDAHGSDGLEGWTYDQLGSWLVSKLRLVKCANGTRRLHVEPMKEG